MVASFILFLGILPTYQGLAILQQEHCAVLSGKISIVLERLHDEDSESKPEMKNVIG
jgi:hypothetical protein